MDGDEREVRRRRTAGVPIGSILGFDIDLDYSWFVLFFLILATFTGAVFPQYVEGLSQLTYVVMGLAGTLLFFVSLLAHELAHALEARRRGIEVEGITLFIFGGMARTRSEAATPGAEFVIAAVGPVASLLLGALLYGTAVVADLQGWHAAIWGVAGHLAFLNVALAVFNLLPGFPLDGGRLLRSVLWKVTGSLRNATRIASLAGRALGWTIILLGVWVLLVANQLVSGLWFIFIGWFLDRAATASYEQLLLQIVLQDRIAEDAMTHFPETVGPDVTLDSLVRDYFMKRPYNSFPVTDDGIVIGLVTLSQVKPVDEEEWPDRTVADVMTPLVDTLIVNPESPMNEVLERMNENETRRVLVAREWELRGIITGGDIANWLDRAGLVK